MFINNKNDIMTTYIRYDAKRAASTVTGDYLNFIASTLDIMDQQEDFKGYYLIMDNAPIHKHKDIKLYVESCGYGGMNLPPYSPGLSPIEQLWSVCKSKLKREAPLKEKYLTLRIREACSNAAINDLKDFCRYSLKKFDDCLEPKPV